VPSTSTESDGGCTDRTRRTHTHPAHSHRHTQGVHEFVALTRGEMQHSLFDCVIQLRHSVNRVRHCSTTMATPTPTAGSTSCHPPRTLGGLWVPRAEQQQLQLFFSQKWAGLIPEHVFCEFWFSSDAHSPQSGWWPVLLGESVCVQEASVPPRSSFLLLSFHARGGINPAVPAVGTHAWVGVVCCAFFGAKGQEITCG
jgi:hypothetical protein